MAEVPATVAPAGPSLNDRFYSVVWDGHAQNGLLLYIHNIQFLREVDYSNSRDQRLVWSETVVRVLRRLLLRLCLW